MRRLLTTLVTLVAFLLLSSLSIADTRSNIEQLKNNDDYRVRVQAALALGSSGDEAAVPALCEALAGDSNVTVRVAAAAALGKLGKPSSLPCLRRQQGKESASNVKAQIDKSIGQIEGGGGGGGGVAPGTKYYVQIQVTNKTSRSPAEIEGIVRGAIQAKLQASSGYAVAPKSESVDAGGQVIKSKNLKGFFLLATVEAPVYAGSNLTQVVRLSMFTYPDKALKGETSNKLTQSDTPTKDPSSENELMKQCAENVVANFQKVINTL